ncbi:MAG: hypothetical protein JWM64_976 [Frankiales bacterium]|nr:hypothetical protein [Frankiales bacterium]
MSAGDLPSSEELLAHVDTALEAAGHWLWRGQQSRPADQEGWENATYFARVLLVRASDRSDQLGYVLQRESLAGQPPEERHALRSAMAYWRESDVDLQQARGLLRDLAESKPDDLGARRLLTEARDLVQAAAGWVDQISKTLDDARGPDRSPPGPAVALVPEQYRSDDGWELDIA